MSDILERVQGARDDAFRIFLKEYATHNLARLVVDSADILDKALVASGRTAISDFVKTSRKKKVELTISIYQELLTDVSRGNMSTLALNFDKLIEKDPDLANLFFSLRQHVAHGNFLIEESRKEYATVSDKKRAEPVIRHLRGMISAGVNRGYDMIDKIKDEEMGKGWSPEVLILQGGGAKGMSYVGVLQAMQDKGMLDKIKMVAGTSAGALIATPVALGYTAEEITDIVNTARFAQFFSESTMKFRVAMKIKALFKKSEPEKTPHYEGNLLVDFTTEHFLPALESATGIPKKRWASFTEGNVQEYLRDLEKGQRPLISGLDIDGQQVPLGTIYQVAMNNFQDKLVKEGRGSDIELLQFGGIPGRTVPYQAAITCLRLERPKSQPDGDIIEAFIGDIIQEKIKRVPVSILRELNPPIKTIEEMRSVSFSQLQQLTERYPIGNFKELGVAATVSYMPVTFSNISKFIGRVVERTKKRFANEDENGADIEVDKNFSFKPIFYRAYDDVKKESQSNSQVKQAVRASMNIPFLFKALSLNNFRHIDGGVNSNYAARMFADKFSSLQEAYDKTIGFMLSTVESDIEMKAIGNMINSKSEWVEEMVKEAGFLEKAADFGKRLRHPLKLIGDGIKKVLAWQVESFMSRNNTMPSLEAMNNIGIINTGTVGTADFNASLKEKKVLAAQGANAFLDLTSLHSDRRLRYAVGRLVSLTSIENKLLLEKGLPVNLEDPVHQVRDPDSLAASLKNMKYESWEFSDLLLDKKPKAAGKLKYKIDLTNNFEEYGFSDR